MFPMFNPVPARRPRWLRTSAALVLVLMSVLTACGSDASSGPPRPMTGSSADTGVARDDAPSGPSRGDRLLTEIFDDHPELRSAVEDTLGADSSRVNEECLVITLIVFDAAAELAHADDPATVGYLREVRDQLLPLAPRELAGDLAGFDGETRRRSAALAERWTQDDSIDDFLERAESLDSEMKALRPDVSAIDDWAVKGCAPL